MKKRQTLYKRLLALTLVLCMIGGMMPAMSWTVRAQEITSGTGSAESPVPIRTAEDLAQIGRKVNNGSIFAMLGVPKGSLIHYRLEADLSLSDFSSGSGWIPIGTEANPFTGVFDGNGYRILGLTLAADTGDNPESSVFQGLFGVVGADGRVTGLTVSDASVQSAGTGSVSSGILAGRLQTGGVIENCFVSGRMDNQTTGGDGGIVGSLEGGEVRNCLVTASLTGSGFSGGVFGYASLGAAPRGRVSGCMILSQTVAGGALGHARDNVTASGCYAWAGMDTGTFEGVTARSVEALQGPGGWPEGLKNDPWRYEEGGMPTLTAGDIQPLPTHLLGGFAGSGTEQDPYRISDVNGLALFARMSRKNSFDGVHFKLTASLDMNQYAAEAATDPAFDPEYDQVQGWSPIRGFYGVFDGGGNAIKNLFIHRPELYDVGFFGWAKSRQEDYESPKTCILRDLGIEDADVTGGSMTGALVGSMTYGAIRNCYSTGTVNGSKIWQMTTQGEDRSTGGFLGYNAAGGLVGKALGCTVTECYSRADVTGVTSVGGVAGFFWGELTDCYATGDVFGKYSHGIGGVVGMDHWEDSLIARCYSTGKVEAGPLHAELLTTWIGTGGVVGFGVGSCAYLRAINPLVKNNVLSELTPTSVGVPQAYLHAVVGLPYRPKKNEGSVSWQGLELGDGHRGLYAGSAPAAFFGDSKCWSEYALDKWRTKTGGLPTLKNTGGPQDSAMPSWLVDLPSDLEVKEPVLSNNVYVITEAAELAWCTLNPEELHSKVLRFEAKRIDLSAYSAGRGWLPIGYDTVIENLKVEGNGCTITGMTMSYFHTRGFDSDYSSNSEGLGLFGKLRNADIRGLHLRSVHIEDYSPTCIGMLLAYGENISIVDCSAEGSIEVNKNGSLGGLAGFIEEKAAIHQVSVRGSIRSKNYGRYMGGILGCYDRAKENDSFSLTQAFSDVDLSTKGTENGGYRSVSAGGLVGKLFFPYPYNSVTTLMENCYSIGHISSTDRRSESKGGFFVGGLVGEIAPRTRTGKAYRIANCYVGGQILGGYAGAVFGYVNAPESDNAFQVQLDNVVLLPQKVEGIRDVGYVYGYMIGSMLHFNDTDQFTQTLYRWNGIPYLLDGAAATEDDMTDGNVASLSNNLTAASKLCSDFFLQKPWNDTNGPWQAARGALPILSTLRVEDGHLPQSWALPLYLRLAAGGQDMKDSVTISTREELDQLSKYVAEGGNTLNLTLLLAKSIDMGEAPFTPIGTAEHPFKGTFDGQGHSIRGLTVNTTTPAGFFGVTAEGSRIQNLAITDPHIRGGKDTGALAGVLGGTVQNCYAAAENVYPWSDFGGTWHVQGTNNTGGLIGRINGATSDVENCYTALHVLAAGNNAGGLIGLVEDSAQGGIRRCYTVGRVTARGQYAGGLYGGCQKGARLTLESILVLSPVVMDRTGNKDCAIGGDTAAGVLENGKKQLFAWEGLDATWNRADPAAPPLSPMRMSDEDSGDNLCKGTTWSEDMGFAPAGVWQITDGASAVLAGFADPQPNFVRAGQTANVRTLIQEGGYYLIQSVSDWERMGALVAEHPQTYAGAKYRLMADIAFGDGFAYVNGYEPVGRAFPFTGELDGGGHTITFDPRSFVPGDIGLFGVLGNGAYIHDLIVDAAITNTGDDASYTAAVAALMEAGSALKRITVTGYVTGGANSPTLHTGGIAGNVRGSILSCVNRATVTNKSTGRTGGIAAFASRQGQTPPEIALCQNEGVVTGNGQAGGILASGEFVTLKDCKNTAPVTGAITGGIAGRLTASQMAPGTASALANTGNITGTGYAGGLVGYLEYMALKDVYSTGFVTGSGTGVGGLVGRAIGSSITRGFATGSVSGQKSVGGLVGSLEEMNQGASADAFLRNTAALNDGVTGSADEGRLVGSFSKNLNLAQALTDSYGLDDLPGGNARALAQGSDVTRETLHTRGFWTDALNLSADAWNIPAADTLAADFSLPTLKSLEDTTSPMPLHLTVYAREGDVTLTLAADKTKLWAPKETDDTVTFTATVTGTTQTAIAWTCTQSAYTLTESTDKDGNPVCTVTIPEGADTDYAGGIFTMTASLAANSAITDAVPVTVKARTNAKAPKVETEPKDTPTTVGTVATLTVKAASTDGGALSYQWYQVGTGGEKDQKIEHATKASFAAPAAATGITGYYCIITNTIPDGEGIGHTSAETKTNEALVTVTKAGQAALTIKGGSRTLTYGDADVLLETQGGSGTGEITWESSDPSVAFVDADGTLTIHKAADEPATIAATKAADDAYEPSTAAITVTVNKAALTVTADSKTRAYREANPTLTYTYTGFVKGEDQTVLTKEPSVTCLADTDAPVGTYPITLAGGEADNYAFTYVGGTLTVTTAGQEPLVILEGPQVEKTYGDDAFALTLSGGSGNGAVQWTSSDETVATVAADGAVTITGAGTAAITAHKAADAAYVAAQASTVLTVYKAPLTVTAEDKTRAYGQDNPVFAYTYAGFVKGEDKNVLTKEPSVTCPAGADAPVGTYPITLTGGAADNYDFVYKAGILTVTRDAQAALSIEGGSRTLTYGDGPIPLKIRGGSGTGTLTWESSDPGAASVASDGTLRIHKAFDTPVTITAQKAGDDRYEPAGAAITVTANKAVLTVTADNKTKDYGQDNPALTYTITGFVNGEGESVLTAKPTLTCQAGPDAAVGTHPILVTGGASDNYDFVCVAGTLTVTAAGQTPLTILEGAQIGKTYGDASFVLTLSGGSGDGAVQWSSSDETVTAVDADGRVTIQGAGTAILTAKKEADGAYVPTQASTVLTVHKASLAVTADNKMRTWGQENPAFTYTVTGFVSGEDAGVLTTAPTLTCQAGPDAPVGAYAITPAGAVAANYTFRYQAGVLTVTRDAQQALTIPGGNRTVTYGDADFRLLTSGGSGTGALTWESSDPAVASVDATGALALHRAGETTVTATKAGDDRYEPSRAAVTITVNKAALTVTADNKTRAYGEANPAFTLTYAGFVKGEDESVLTTRPALSCQAGADAAVGTHPILVTGGAADNYRFVYRAGTLTVTAAGQEPLAILSGTQINKTYGDAPFTLAVTGGSGNGALTWESSDETIATVGTDGTVTLQGIGAAAITAKKAADGLYAAAQASTIVTVDKALLTVTADNAEKSYGEPHPALTCKITGFVNGEDESVLAAGPAVTVDAAQPEAELPVGSYVIRVGGAAADHYRFRYENGTLIVNKANQRTFGIETPEGGLTRVYGDAPFTLTAKNGAGGAVTWESSNENIAAIDAATGEVTVKGAGRALITAVSAETGNYAEAIAAVTLTIEKAKLTIKADDVSIKEGGPLPTLTWKITEGSLIGDDTITGTLTAKGTAVGTHAIVEDEPFAHPNYAVAFLPGILTVTAAETPAPEPEPKPEPQPGPGPTRPKPAPARPKPTPIPAVIESANTGDHAPTGPLLTALALSAAALLLTLRRRKTRHHQ